MLARLLLLITVLAPLPSLAQLRWVEGVHYETLAAGAKPDVPAGKIEVTEVFSYGCPYCFQAMKDMATLKSSLPEDAVMTYLPASFIPSEGWPMFQRAYLTAKMLGIAEVTHELMFVAIWQSGEFPYIDPATGTMRKQLPTIEAAARFYESHSSVKATEFLALASSPQIDAQMKKADALVLAYRIPGTPALVVNGRYLINAAKVGSYAGVAQLVNYLVGVERTRLKNAR
jgi:protein dithiol oxidoreductase (disulfide-forming)